MFEISRPDTLQERNALRFLAIMRTQYVARIGP